MANPVVILMNSTATHTDITCVYRTATEIGAMLIILAPHKLNRDKPPKNLLITDKRRQLGGMKRRISILGTDWDSICPIRATLTWAHYVC